MADVVPSPAGRCVHLPCAASGHRSGLEPFWEDPWPGDLGDGADRLPRVLVDEHAGGRGLQRGPGRRRAKSGGMAKSPSRPVGAVGERAASPRRHPLRGHVGVPTGHVPDQPLRIRLRPGRTPRAIGYDNPLDEPASRDAFPGDPSGYEGARLSRKPTLSWTNARGRHARQLSESLVGGAEGVELRSPTGRSRACTPRSSSDSGLWVRDLESRNCTFVQGVRVTRADSGRRPAPGRCHRSRR